MPRRPIKGKTGANRILCVSISEELHSKMVDLAHKKNTHIRVLVTECLEELVKKDQH
jgi:hypothetical protein